MENQNATPYLVKLKNLLNIIIFFQFVNFLVNLRIYFGRIGLNAIKICSKNLGDLSIKGRHFVGLKPIKKGFLLLFYNEGVSIFARSCVGGVGFISMKKIEN